MSDTTAMKAALDQRPDGEKLVELVLSCTYDMDHVTPEDVGVIAYRLEHSTLFAAALATPAGPEEPGLREALEVAHIAVGVCNDWMGDPDHGFILDPLALPVDAFNLAQYAALHREPPR